MTRQDGGTGPHSAFYVWPYKWWPGPAVARSLGILGMVLLLGGCTGPFGTAMSGLFGAGAMYAGQAALNRGQEDVEAKILHRAQRKEIVTAALNSKRQQCEQLGASTLQFECYQEMLAFHDTQHPETLLMELRRRAEAPGPGLSGFEKARRQRIKERNEVVPEPKMVAPANQ